MATIYIDKQPLEVKDGDNLLEAVLDAGIDLPYFCWHPEMGSVGACRQCAVVQFRDEEDTQGRIVMGCMTPVTDGAHFSLSGETASTFRSNIVESLMLNHPHDCPVCAEGGECHLQDMTVMVGHRDRRYRGRKNTHSNQYLGPLLHHEMNRCITCYRCTRYYQDYAGGTDLAAHAAHDHVYFGRHEDGILESEFAGNLVEVCPTGVFTDKTLVNDYTRKWDMQSAPSVCTGCAVGCNTIAGERYGKLKRIHNRYNHEVNGYFLCDRGRYGSTYVNHAKRPHYAGVLDTNNQFNAVNADDAIKQVADLIKPGKVVAVGSARASLESNFLLSQLVGEDNFYAGSSLDNAANQLMVSALAGSGVRIPTLRETEQADAVLILGEDISNTAPRTALAIRQAAKNKGRQMAAEMNIPLWQDEAVQNLTQDQVSPIFSIGVNASRLADITTEHQIASPVEIAEIGQNIAEAINNSKDEDSFATRAAQALTHAKRPLIVSGTGLQSGAVIDAAVAIAQALQANNDNTRLSLSALQANSVGLALLQQNKANALDDLSARIERGEIDTLLVMENDISRVFSESAFSTLCQRVTNCIVMDILPNATMSQATIALPAASVIESEGTLVSSEGRAQRHFPAFLAENDRTPSWQWLTKIGQQLGKSGFANIKYFDDVIDLLVSNCPHLAAIKEASPDAHYRNRGLKIPRQTHRYSGRTAMLADKSVHEPKQPEDPDSALAFTMEGRNDVQPGSLLPYVWSPGWNSNQSLHKFQNEIGGALKGGTAGKRLFDNTGNGYQPSAAKPNQPNKDSLTVVPGYQVFGSDELSSQCEAIKELVPGPYVLVHPDHAEGFNHGQQIVLQNATAAVELELQISEQAPKGCAVLAQGLGNHHHIGLYTQVSLNPRGSVV